MYVACHPKGLTFMLCVCARAGAAWRRRLVAPYVVAVLAVQLFSEPRNAHLAQ